MNFDIDEMNENDLRSLASNLTLNFDDFWSYNLLKQEFLNETSHIFVAKDSNKNLLGFISVQFILDEACITNIVTKKTSRGHGIGSALLKFVIDFSKKFNMSNIYLEVNVNNSSAISLYKKFGFKQVGLRKNYYNGDDALVLSLNRYQI